jgi:hypothetical protein
MSKSISKVIDQRVGNDSLIEMLSEHLTGSEITSILLEVFSRRTKKLTAPELLKLYSANRFVQPAETNYLKLLERSINVLKVFEQHGFESIQLSPVSQLGTSSVIACVDQDKVLSTLRNCEVLSDATNALALYISHLKKNSINPGRQNEHLKYSSVQRHVRTQPIDIKGFSPHFTIGCLVSSGSDTGSFAFETKAIGEHFMALHEMLKKIFQIDTAYFKLQKRNGYSDQFISVIHKYLSDTFPELVVKIEPETSNNNYYNGIQFKTVIIVKGQEIEIADGGFVDWTQKLLNNRKERLCISGFGLELLNKFEEGLI